MRMLLLGIDADLAGDLDLRLRPKGHELTWCRHSREGVELANADHPIVVVEWPGPEGADVAWLDRIRGQHPDATLLVLSPAAHLAPLADRVKRLGCTFVLKPIALDVLAAQLHEFAEGGTGLRSGQRRCADVDLHPAQRVAFRRGMQVKLTHREWLLLDTLLQGVGRIVPKDEIAARVVFDSNVPDNAVEVHLSNIRRKLGRGLIETIRGRGYRIPE
jgi:two-component system, OmpR family, response regulator